MKKSLPIVLCVASLLAPTGLNAFAQGSTAPKGRPPANGFDPHGEELARNRPPGRGPRRSPEKMRLGRLWRGISDLEGSNAPLSNAQAKRVVAIVLPWSKKPAMSAENAEKLEERLKVVLTSTQKSVLDATRFEGPPGGRGPREGRRGFSARPERPRGDSPRGDSPRGGFGRGGGTEREGGRRFRDQGDDTRQTMQIWMDSFNLFYPPTGNPNWKKLPARFQQETARRYRENRATLEALSRKSKS